MKNNASMTLDQRLQTAVIHHPHLNSSKIHYRARNGNVKIEGTAKNFYEKQLAQELLRNVEGVMTIQNNLTVDAS